ncbi:LacI family DNA-binding transcriptional regulator [Actinomyces sp. MRS3W]|uniref:LacI family DNA-binding transcriptional regulator n=1 Tax=Actinomyces sp. MRS3W TaxID=2800796 RepID=UPI0028FD2D2C|nr:LacI family DNA-binding transcriptional regulator [Actinomyces sp. MRS3W]MDU0349225.1 LacI family DNA-binding transcriptional regulator [Actinomyces sp. MRS3W]
MSPTPRPASTHATQQDVAAAAGVSRGLVSLALKGEGRMSEETRRRILDAAAKLDYHPHAAAAELAARHSQRLAVVVPYLDNPFFDLLLRALRRRAKQAGYTLVALVSDLADDLESSTIDDVLSLRPAGLILPGTSMTTKELQDLGARVRLCVIDRTLPESAGIATVRLDEADAARLTVEHLASQGYERLVFLSPALRLQETILGERVKECRAAAAAAGLGFAEVNADAGVKAAISQALATGTGPLGLIAYNDLLAIDAVAAGLSLGLRIPADLGISSYDNTSLAERAELRITSIDQHPDMLATGALEALLAPGTGSVFHRVVPAQLVARSSTARR